MKVYNCLDCKKEANNYHVEKRYGKTDDEIKCYHCGGDLDYQYISFRETDGLGNENYLLSNETHTHDENGYFATHSDCYSDSCDWN